MTNPKQVPVVEIHDENARIVKGWGTVDVFDKANERLPIDEFKRIMPIIMKRGGIVMNRHTNQPAGRILNYQFLMKDTPEGQKEGVYLETEVYKDFGSDDEIWDGIKKGEIEGFSFGGKNNLEDVEFSKGVSQKTLKGLEGFEFSYVPKGCNQEATIEEVNYIAKEDVVKPFAGFEDFAACERANQDKDDPAAFCAYLKERVEKIEKEYKNEKTEESEKTENTDDKTLSKSVSTLNTDTKKDESFIKNKVLNKNMAEEEDKKDETKKEETKKVEDVPMAANTEAPTEDPVARIEAKIDQLISVLSNTNKADEEEDKKPKEEDKDVEKEGDGEKVKLPESEGDETSQAKPAEGGKGDEGGANFLEKEGIAKIKEDVKNQIMKELIDNKADTPRPAVKSNDIQKSKKTEEPKNFAEANRTVKRMGLN